MSVIVQITDSVAVEHHDANEYHVTSGCLIVQHRTRHRMGDYIKPIRAYAPGQWLTARVNDDTL
jgi:hypothetical protein